MHLREQLVKQLHLLILFDSASPLESPKYGRVTEVIEATDDLKLVRTMMHQPEGGLDGLAEEAPVNDVRLKSTTIGQATAEINSLSFRVKHLLNFAAVVGSDLAPASEMVVDVLLGDGKGFPVVAGIVFREVVILDVAEIMIKVLIDLAALGVETVVIAILVVGQPQILELLHRLGVVLAVEAVFDWPLDYRLVNATHRGPRHPLENA